MDLHVSQVGIRIHAVILHHIQQFEFSPLGALRLKADMNEYTECAREMGLPQLLEKFISAQVGEFFPTYASTQVPGLA
jgi:hypothetical protein